MLLSNLILNNINIITFQELKDKSIEQIYPSIEILKDVSTYHNYTDHSRISQYYTDEHDKEGYHDKQSYTKQAYSKSGSGHKEGYSNSNYSRQTAPHTETHDKVSHTENGYSQYSASPGTIVGVYFNHTQTSGGHYNGHYEDHNNTYSEQDHRNTVTETTKDIDIPHRNHTNNYPYYSPDEDITYDRGFNHVNYVPSKVFFNINAGEKIRDISKIMFFAVDGNAIGKGSQDSDSKKVLYDVQIRKLSNLDGTPNVSGWRNLVSNADFNEYNLNTKDPLNTGTSDWKSTEGVYEIKAVAKNPSISKKGVSKSYVGSVSSVVFTIQQNYLPQITILNGDKFIGYTFGEESIRNTNDLLSPFMNNEGVEGIPIKIKITDQDLADVHKAYITVVDNSETEIISRFPITLQDKGVSGDRVIREGFFVIPKSSINHLGEKMDSKIKIIVEDFQEGNFSKPTGTIIETIRKLSFDSSSEYLKIDIDTIAPRVTFGEIISEYKQFYNLRTFVEDNEGSGITKVEYQILKNGAGITEENWITQHEQNTKGLLTYDFDTRIEEFGNFKVAIRVTDYVDNKRVVISDIMNIAPITESKLSILPKYPSSLPASEMFDVKVEYLCDLELHEPVIKVKTKSGAPFAMDFTGRMEKTTSTNGKQVFKIQVPVDKRVHDGDLDFEVFTNRKDTAFDNNTVDVRYTLNDKGKIFTPINLERANSPTIVADRDTIYLARTTKYVEDTKIKLYIGTPNETGWIPMTAEIQPDGSKVWGYATTTPSSIQSNQIYQIKSTLPTGKFEDLEYQAAYLKVDSVFEHTDEWLERLKGYNRWKSGNENTPRTLDIYFAGENLVIKTETDSDTDTPVTEVGFRLFKEDRTEITTDKILLNSKSRNIIGELVRENWEVNSNILSLTKNNQNIGKIKLEKLYVILYVTIGDVVEYEYFIEVDDSDGAFKGYREW